MMFARIQPPAVQSRLFCLVMELAMSSYFLRSLSVSRFLIIDVSPEGDGRSSINDP